MEVRRRASALTDCGENTAEAQIHVVYYLRICEPTKGLDTSYFLNWPLRLGGLFIVRLACDMSKVM